MTLHEAIKQVLKEQNKNLLPTTIADIINQKKLYFREDKKPLPASQITARISEYPKIFLKHLDGTISLKRDKYEDLINLNSEIVNILRDSNFFADELLVTSLYFFKRIIDNPSKFKNIIEFDSERLRCNIQGFRFFVFLIEKSPLFKEIIGKLTFNIDSERNKEAIEKIFNILNIFSLSEENISSDIFSKFFNLVLSDNISRKSIGNFYPHILTDIIGVLVEHIQFNTLYIPYSGYCSIATSFKQQKKFKFEYYGEEPNLTTYAKGLMNLIINWINPSNFYNTNPFINNKYLNNYDLVICVPPFGLKTTINFNSFRQNVIFSKDLIANIIQIILEQISETGRAIILVPENYLYGKDSLKLRKLIIKENLLESVISLPSGIFYPLSTVKTSILIFTKKHSNKYVDFINLTEFLNFENNKPNSFNREAFLELIKDKDLEVLNSSKIDDYLKRSISTETISQTYNLACNKYLKVENTISDSKIPLKKVCEIFKNKLLTNDENIVYVNIKDLNKNYFNINLKTESLELNRGKRAGILISENALLIGSIYGSVKPTFFRKQDKDILLSSNIYAYKINTDLIDPEYLIYELSSKEVSDQLEAISFGASSIRRINRSEFLQIMINCPSMEEQLKILKDKKDAIISAKFNEADLFAKEMGVSSRTEEKLLGFVKHEIGNIIGGVNSNIRNIVAALNRYEINMQNKVSSRPDSPTIIESFEIINKNLEDVNNLMTNIQSVIDLKNVNISKLYFKKIIKSEVEKIQSEMQDFNFYYGINEDFNSSKDIEINLDRQQFGLVIRNFLINSLRHGYNNNQKNKNIVFNLSSDADFNYISLINDGDPFPENFDIDNFKAFGERYDNSKGSGLGGYLITKVIENLHGEITLMESGTTIFLDRPLSKPEFISPSFIKVGVHFYIKLLKILNL